MSKQTAAAYGPGLPSAGGWKRHMVENERPPTYDHEWASERINERNRYREALEKIAAAVRPDGTYNLSREACEQIAREALDG